MFYSATNRLQGCSSNPLVDARGDTEEGDACSADGECNAGACVALEGGQGRVGLSDIHGLDDEEGVVE